ncbi:thrRS/alaRS common domain-containing protein [Colletotrichum tofieldiae]|nr:thrRS/alaRS common domain-containing protein [Colletotrichum tofieldiae]
MMRELVTSVVSWQPLTTLEENDRAQFKSVFNTRDGAIVTKEIIFHPQGGGQPSDCGTIVSKENPLLRFEVHLVRKLPNGLILHAVKRVTAEVNITADGSVPAFRNSEPVLLRIDHQTCDFHSRLHTAGHLVGLAVRQLAGKIVVVSEVKANHAPGSSFVEFAGQISGEHKAAIQAVVDDMVASNRTVNV